MMADDLECNDVTLFKAVVNSDMEYFRALPLDDQDELNKLNTYISFKVHPQCVCLCHIEYERFEGTPAEMLEKYERIIEIGLCDHYEGRPKCPSDTETEEMQGSILDELEIDMLFLGNDYTIGLAGLKPLHIAALLNHTELASWLLDNGVPIDAPGLRYRDPPINLAVIRGHNHMVSLLMTRGTDQKIMAEKTMFTPVYLAVERNRKEVLEALIEHGACCTENSVYGEKPLTTAVSNGRADIVKLLIRGGALTPSGWNTAEPENEALLCKAIRTNTEIARMLIEGGADLNAIVDDPNRIAFMIQHGYKESPPIILCTTLGKLDFLRMLLEKGAKANVCSADKRSALHAAAAVKSSEAFDLLLKFGADINGLNRNNYSAVHQSALDGHLETCKVFLDRGVNHDMKAEDQNTPLSLACRGNHLHMIDFFLSTRRCNFNNKDKNNDTPLHHTTLIGNVEATQLLLTHGANPAAENSIGTTPLWNAIYGGQIRLIQLLLEYTVPVNVCSRGRLRYNRARNVRYIYDTPRSPLYVACDKNLLGVPTLLWQAGLDLSQEQWLFSGDLPQSLQVNNHDSGDDLAGNTMIGELNRMTNSTLSLKDHTRLAIRKILWRKFKKLSDVAYQLELPHTLNDYLNFKAY